MDMNPFVVLNYQTVLSFVALTLIMRWHILPRLSRLPLEEALIPLIWIHVFRYVALTGFLPGQVSPNAPSGAISTVIFGDTLSGLLALVTVVLLERRTRGAIIAAWIFNIVGLADWALSQVLVTSNDIFQYELGASTLIFVFYVPLLVITHTVMLYWLVRRKGDSGETGDDRPVQRRGLPLPMPHDERP